MRKNLFVIGIVLLIIGLLSFVIGYNGAAEYRTVLGQVGRIVSQKAQQEYKMFMLMETVGAIVAVIGFGMTAYGAVTGKKSE